MNLGSFADAELQQLDASAVEELLEDVTILHVRAVAGIADVVIVAESVAVKEFDQPMPPRLPHCCSLFLDPVLAASSGRGGLATRPQDRAPPTLKSWGWSTKLSLTLTGANPFFALHSLRVTTQPTLLMPDL